MKPYLLLGLAFTLTATAHAQLPQIRITGIFPPGAQRGTTTDVTVTAGTDLDEASELVFSHPGLKAVAKLDGNGNPVANQFTVTVDPAIQAGLYDVRLRGLFGISNPRIFRVDTIAEVAETEPNNTDQQAQEVALNTVVNARSNGATDVDTFKVNVAAGSTLVVRSEAAKLDSVMQPVVQLFDAAGNRVAHSRRAYQQDAVIAYTSPTEQTLLIRVHDTVYAGSNDYVYRLSIDTRPLVDFAFPQVVQSDAESKVTVFGRHLPEGQPTEMTLAGMPLKKQEVTVNFNAADQKVVGTDSSATSIDTALYAGIDGNLLQFAVSSSPPAAITLEDWSKQEPQTVAVPATVAGSFEVELDEDAYRFEAKKGEAWQIDVLANRLGSPADPLLIVERITKAEDGTETAARLAREDASKQNPGGANLPTLTSDPSFLLTAPEDGVYQVRIQDRYAASRGTADLTYHIAIQKPAPDFQLVVFDSLPSADGKAPPTAGAVSLRKGGTYDVPVYVYRSGGHAGEIQLQVEGLPEGVTVAGTSIPAGQASAVLVFSAAAEVGELIAPARIVGTSAAGETQIQRSAKVATLVHDGANGLPRTARASGSLLVSVMKDEEPFRIQPLLTEASVTQDQQLLIPLKLIRRAGFEDKVDIAFAGQPGNVDVPKVAIEKGQDSAIARFYFKDNAAVGPATLLMYATAAVPYSRNPWQVERAQAAVAAAVEKLAAETKTLADSKAAAEAGQKKVTELAAMLKTYDEQLKAEQTAQAAAAQELKTAVASKTEATKQLVAVQEQLNKAAANTNPESENLDAAIKAVQDATNAVTEASKPVLALVAKIEEINGRVAAKEKLVVEKTKQIADATAAMTAQQQAVEKALAAVKAAEAGLAAQEAAKKAAEEATKKAQEAAKPKNLNDRTIAIPVRLDVHATPGKIVAAVPNAGAIKKGATAEVKVTLTRKNNFAGPVKVSLVLPEGISGVTSNTVDIAADQTEATLTLTAAADAAPADIANAVIRATAEFNGRMAAFDAPTALKITE